MHITYSEKKSLSIEVANWVAGNDPGHTGTVSSGRYKLNTMTSTHEIRLFCVPNVVFVCFIVFDDVEAHIEDFEHAVVVTNGQQIYCLPNSSPVCSRCLPPHAHHLSSFFYSPFLQNSASNNFVVELGSAQDVWACRKCRAPRAGSGPG